MVSKRQLNSSKRRLNERIKDVKDCMEKEEKSSNLVDAETQTELLNEAKEAITGLETTEANYKVAVNILQERYGKKQLIINAHYAKLKEMPISSTYYEKLQSTYDTIKKHLRSLEALGGTLKII